MLIELKTYKGETVTIAGTELKVVLNFHTSVELFKGVIIAKERRKTYKGGLM